MPMEYPALVPPPPLSFQAFLYRRNVEEGSMCVKSALLLRGVGQPCMECVGVFAGPTDYLRMAVKWMHMHCLVYYYIVFLQSYLE